MNEGHAFRIPPPGSAPLLLDGPTGTMLGRAGCDVSPPLWSARALTDDPEAVAAIHRAFVAAGADVITANTFRTTRFAYAAAGLPERAAQDALSAAARLAREAADATVNERRPVHVALSIAPLADCYRPDLVPDAATCAAEFRWIVETLRDTEGVECVLVETMNTIREAVAAVRASGAMALPTIVSFVLGPGGRLLSGESLEDAARSVLDEGAHAVGINCVPPDEITPALERLRRALPTDTPLVAYANAGRPAGEPDSASVAVPRYLEFARAWLDLGVSLIGSCCDTTPAHAGGLRALIDARELG